MKAKFNADRLDIGAFARDGSSLAKADVMRDYRRLATEAVAPVEQRLVRWSAVGEVRSAAGRPAQPWLHLKAEAALPMICQRCLEPVDVALEVDRWFRFVDDEETAAAEDEDAEEDVLAIAPDFGLRQLVEDELLLVLPVVPIHDHCPIDINLAAVDPEFERASAATQNPFAALDQLRGRGKS